MHTSLNDTAHNDLLMIIGGKLPHFEREMSRDTSLKHYHHSSVKTSHTETNRYSFANFC